MTHKNTAARLPFGGFSFLLILIMSLGCALFTTVANAESSAPTYLPSFQYGTNTYVDDRIAGSMRFDSAFAAQVRSLEGQHNLKFYVVVTERGNDLTGERRTWAASLLRNKLWDQWLNAADFKQGEQRSAILLMVRDYADPSHYSVALRVGGDLHNLGLNRDLFGAPNGPIVPALKTYLPVMPEQCLLAVLGNVNDLVQRGKQLQAQKDSQTNRGTDEPTAVKSEPAISDNNSNEGIQPMTIALLIAAAVGVFFLLRALFRGPQSTSRPTPPARSTPVVLRKTERGSAPTGTSTQVNSDTGSKTDNTGAIIGTAVGAGMLGHMIGSQQAEAAERARRERESSSTSSTSGGDSTYIPPVIADTTTTTTTSDGGGSTGGSSCGSSGGSSCGGGGSSCGGGGGCGS